MTIDEAIAQADALKPNQVERAQKIAWLTQLDGWIFSTLMKRHAKDGETPERFTPYTQASSPDTELLAKPPYDEMYRFYLEMHIDLVNLEFDKYNNSAALYTAAWGQFARAYHREHRFKQSANALKF